MLSLKRGNNMVIKDLNEIKNKDVSKMSDVELANFRVDIMDTMSSANKTTKLGLFKKINWLTSYIGGFGLMAVAINTLYPFVLTGAFVGLVKNILIGVAVAVPMITASVLEKKAKGKVKNIRDICNDKIAEVDRQIATQKYIESLKQSDIQNIVKNNEQVAQTNNDKGYDFYKEQPRTNKEDDLQR